MHRPNVTVNFFFSTAAINMCLLQATSVYFTIKMCSYLKQYVFMFQTICVHVSNNLCSYYKQYVFMFQAICVHVKNNTWSCYNQNWFRGIPGIMPIH